jgi:hypothetical protein
MLLYVAGIPALGKPLFTTLKRTSSISRLADCVVVCHLRLPAAVHQPQQAKRGGSAARRGGNGCQEEILLHVSRVLIHVSFHPFLAAQCSPALPCSLVCPLIPVSAPCCLAVYLLAAVAPTPDFLFFARQQVQRIRSAVVLLGKSVTHHRLLRCLIQTAFPLV